MAARREPKATGEPPFEARTPPAPAFFRRVFSARSWSISRALRFNRGKPESASRRTGGSGARRCTYRNTIFWDAVITTQR